ncbi:MAG: hypothetical protein QXT45_05960 [Candidatus Bilamarchaeaceae archaeon]
MDEWKEIAPGVKFKGNVSFDMFKKLSKGDIVEESNENVMLTDEERKALAASGMSDNEISSISKKDLYEIAKKVAESNREEAKKRMEEMLGQYSSNPFKYEEVSIDSLPPDKQLEIMKKIEEISEKINLTDIEKLENAKKRLMEISKKMSQQQEEIPDKDHDHEKDHVEQNHEDEEKEKSNSNKEAKSLTGISEVAKFCPHCGWDLSVTDTATITDFDRDAFIQSFIFGVRFTKRYEMLNGNLIVTFRDLSAEESKECWDYIQMEARTSLQNALQLEVLNTLLEYRMACGLASVQIGKRPAIELPEFSELKSKNKDMTVKDYVNKIRKEILKTESAWRMTLVAFANFQRLVEKLEAEGSKKDFFTKGQPG